MVIDWNAVSRSPGYRSLKAAYIRDVQENNRRARPMRNKEEFLRRFRWVIGRAKHYATRQGRSLEDVLNEWEAERDHWWLNYYQDAQQPRLRSGRPGNVRPPGSAHYLKHHRMLTASERRQRLARERQRYAQFQRKRVLNKKPRWSPEQKHHAARMRRYRQQSL